MFLVAKLPNRVGPLEARETNVNREVHLSLPRHAVKLDFVNIGRGRFEQGDEEHSDREEEDEEKAVDEVRIIQSVIYKGVIVAKVSQHPHDHLHQCLGKRDERQLIGEEEVKNEGEEEDDGQDIHHALQVTHDETLSY